MLEKIVFSTKAAVVKKTSRFRVGDVILIPSNLTDIRKAKKGTNHTNYGQSNCS